MLSAGEPFELAGRSRSMGVEAILLLFFYRRISRAVKLKPRCDEAVRLPTEATEAVVASQVLF